MASDNLNLLEGLAGAVSGFTSVYLPLQQELFKKRINSTKVSDFEALLGKPGVTGLDSNKFLTDSEMEIEMERLKADEEKNKEIRQHEFERQKIDYESQARVKEYGAEHKTIGTLYPDETLKPKEFRESGFGNLTPEEGIKLLESRRKAREEERKLEKIPKQDEDQINDIDSVLGDVKSLHSMYRNARGHAPGFVSGARSFVSHLPIVGASLESDQRLYNDEKQKLSFRLIRAQTKSSRGLTTKGAGSELAALPDLSELPKKGEDKFNEIYRTLLNQRNSITRKYENKGYEVPEQPNVPYQPSMTSQSKLNPSDFTASKPTQSISQSDLQVGKEFGGGKIKAVRWK